MILSLLLNLFDDFSEGNRERAQGIDGSAIFFSAALIQPLEEKTLQRIHYQS